MIEYIVTVLAHDINRPYTYYIQVIPGINVIFKTVYSGIEVILRRFYFINKNLPNQKCQSKQLTKRKLS